MKHINLFIFSLLCIAILSGCSKSDAPRECWLSFQCGKGEMCSISGQCQCISDRACVHGGTCEDGKCICQSDSQCNPGLVCNDDKICVPKFPELAIDDDDDDDVMIDNDDDDDVMNDNDALVNDNNIHAIHEETVPTPNNTENPADDLPANSKSAQNSDIRSKITLGTPEITGSLDKRVVQKIVKQHTAELKSCYESELRKKPNINGTITVNWLVSPQGAVTKALVKESTLRNKKVEQCVINAIKFWRFPAPKAGGMANIEYPFEFSTL